MFRNDIELKLKINEVKIFITKSTQVIKLVSDDKNSSEILNHAFKNIVHENK